MEIREGIFDDPSVRLLLARHAEHCQAETSQCKQHRLDADALQAPDIRFWTLWQDGEAVGCIALRDLGAGQGEVKSMHIRAENRGEGGADLLLAHLMNEARGMGLHWLGLETGETPNFHAAIRFYEKHGFAPTQEFAQYTQENSGPLLAREI